MFLKVINFMLIVKQSIPTIDLLTAVELKDVCIFLEYATDFLERWWI